MVSMVVHFLATGLLQIFCTWHDSTAVMSHAKIYNNHFGKICWKMKNDTWVWIENIECNPCGILCSPSSSNLARLNELSVINVGTCLFVPWHILLCMWLRIQVPVLYVYGIEFGHHCVCWCPVANFLIINDSFFFSVFSCYSFEYIFWLIRWHKYSKWQLRFHKISSDFESWNCRIASRKGDGTRILCWRSPPGN